MYVCEKHSLVYIRVPKTGSTTFTRVVPVKEIATGHLSVEQSIKCCSEKWEKYKHFKKIGFIRHPVDWCLSWYISAMMHPSTWETFIGDVPHAEFTPDEAIEYFLANTPTPYDWLTLDGHVAVDEIYRQEDLDEVLPKYGGKPARFNETHKPWKKCAEFQRLGPKLGEIKTKFKRELEHYEDDVSVEQRFGEVLRQDNG